MKMFNRSLFIFIFIFIIGCSALEIKYNKYEVRYIDRYSFDDIILIELYNTSNESIYYLVSNKINDFKRNDFEKLKLDEQYTIFLQKITKPIYAKSRSVDVYSRNKIKIWTNDTFKVDVYKSNYIYDQFIKRE